MTDLNVNDCVYGIYGASGFGSEVLPIARSILKTKNIDYYKRLFLVDDNIKDYYLNNQRIISYRDFLDIPAKKKKISIAIADPFLKKKLYNQCSNDGLAMWELKAENSVMMDNISMDVGAVICPFVTITSNIKIGKLFHANLYSYVAHNCSIGDYVTFAPAVKCNGNIVIEDEVYIGTGAIIKQGNFDKQLRIGRGSVIGMGAVVTKDVAEWQTVIGNPARALTKK